MSEPLRIVHYLNQFFGGVGGEEQAGMAPMRRAGPVGPGVALARAMGDRARIDATLVCGDNYANEQLNDLIVWVQEQLKQLRPDVVIAGPAFNAGRYGQACGALCAYITEQLRIPTLTAMHPKNPGAEQFARMTYIMPTGASATAMSRTLNRMAELAVRLGQGDALGLAHIEGYLPRGVRKNVFRDRPGAERALSMLLRKLRHEPFETELPVQVYQTITPAPPVVDLSAATVAIVTEAGIVPNGNPDRLEFIRASKWHKYPIAGKTDLVAGEYEAVHGGFDNTWTNQDPDRILAVDVLRQLETEGVIGKLFDYYYVTTGNGTPIEKSATFGREIAADLLNNGVQAVVSPAT
jgi:betaine reductase